VNRGYNRPLYLLPFDHRNSYVSGLFDFKMPLTAAQHARVVDSKQLIYEGFKRALADGVPPERAGLLVDEQFGAGILSDAARNGYVTALSTEKSGQAEFEFEYGAEFARHIEVFNPTFAKALVRYNPAADAAANQRQTARLRQLSDYCHSAKHLFMFELLVPATDAQLASVQGDKSAYDLRIRPDLMLEAIHTLQAAGVEPDVWKVEGLDRREDCERIVAQARRDGRTAVSCIVLGRGADAEKVSAWLRLAASVPGFIGFAVGRTSFWDALVAYEAHILTRQEAAADIAKRYREWSDIFARALRAHPGVA
jgi:myo-inositol catabolism protein IolC